MATLTVKLPVLERVALAALAERQGRSESEILGALVRSAIATEFAGKMVDVAAVIRPAVPGDRVKAGTDEVRE